ncbi:MAG: 2-dehydro-3-deoxy-D-gluconate 5-dehydrogenase KduD [Trueperaceae bacterium]|nr:2-dehydro-3-deoxy-D-gluconate 5-dehydrogenase KduD [Trueperaceae bacterium]
MPDLSAFSLEGKVALVTGGATGIGQAIALEMARAGADIAVTENRHSATETVQAVKALGKEGKAYSLNLETLTPESASEFLDRLEQDLGPLNILVNNAGMIYREDATEHDFAAWQQILNVNINATWLLSQAAGKRMMERSSGKIINIASLLSFQGGIRVPAYTSSKHAVAGLTKALANEWASQGIQVNAIAPGYIATNNTEALRSDPERSRQILERIPSGRWGNPKDIAGAAVFLASSAANYITGHILAVDGGWLAR